MESKGIPIQQKLETFPEANKAVWDDMNSWVEKRRREWDDEMAQLKDEFFSLKVDKSGTSRKSSDSSSLQEKMSIGNSKVYETGRGNRMFSVSFDVSQFSPNEVDVRTDGHTLTVHAKHEEKRENKSVSREFNRKVDIPKNVNPDSLHCFIKDDGTLQVEAELPSPSCESSSVITDSSLTTDNTPPDSLYGDRAFGSSHRSDRDDVCSPPRIISPPTTNWSAFSPTRTYRSPYEPRVIDRNADYYNHRNAYRDIYDSKDNDFFDPGRSDRAAYSSPATGRVAYSQTNVSRDDHDSTTANRDLYSPTLIGSNDAGGFRSAGAVWELRSPTRMDSYVYDSPIMENFIRSPRSAERGLYSPVRTERTYDNGLVFDAPVDNLRIRTYSNGSDVTARQDPSIDWNTRVAQHKPEVFRVVVDIGAEFQPHELEVKTVDRKLVVEARHSDSRVGRVNSRDVRREFDLPDGVEPSSLTANFTTDGNLVIEVPTGHFF